MNFMKKLIAIFVVLSLVSCYKTFSNKQNFDKIEMNNVEKILIKKQLYDTLCVEFNQKEIEYPQYHIIFVYLLKIK